MASYQGLIDFSQLGPGTGELRVEPQGHDRCCRLPGLEIRWKREQAEVALADGVLAIVARNARPSAGSDEARRWIERYVRDRARAANEADGGFAIVIVDLRKRQAVLYVDRFSIETLCYRAGDGVLGFSDAASEVPSSNQQLDAQSLYDYLYFHVIPSPRTIFA